METTETTNRDEFFEQAAEIVVEEQQGSVSLLQRRLRLGYMRAGRIIDQLQEAGVVGEYNGAAPREVLIKDKSSLRKFLMPRKSRSSGS